MAKLRFLIIVLTGFFLILMSPKTALADKCEVPEFTGQAIEDAEYIFEGRLERTRDLTQDEWTAAKTVVPQGASPAKNAEQAAEEGLKIFEYKVLRDWKGAKRGSRVLVLFEVGREETLNFGQDALIFGAGKEGNMVWVSPCSLSVPISEARTQGIIDMLNEIIGIGYDIKIPGGDRLCMSSDDCTAVTTHCGGCDCGQPIAVGAVKKNKKKLKEFCSVKEGEQPACAPMSCEQYHPRCIEGQCR